MATDILSHFHLDFSLLLVIYFCIFNKIYVVNGILYIFL